jgi:5-hydroxyisourate hydrolase
MMSQITTHVLDTAKGKPAAGVRIILYELVGNEWKELGKGVTNADGRAANLLTAGKMLAQGMYKMKFETKEYFDTQGIITFYPFVEIVFDIRSGEHYHIPLLLSPFGYNTYRGS